MVVTENTTLELQITLQLYSTGFIADNTVSFALTEFLASGYLSYKDHRELFFYLCKVFYNLPQEGYSFIHSFIHLLILTTTYDLYKDQNTI